MVEDKELIRRYAAERSETAFAELVRRHLNMVYGAALRQVNGDTHLAQDLAQTVFTSLAAKAGTLQGATSIAGWLYTNTRFAAVKAVRAESRRRAREQEVVAMNEISLNGNDGWNELRPLIDEALGELGETDRESIVLRYFQGYEFSLVGAALGVSENAARMRVDRALEKLRVVLQKRGLAATGAALATALADSSASVVPAQLAAVITSAALAQTALPAASATSSILKLLTMNKLAATAIGLAALTLAAVMAVHSSSKPQPRHDAATTPAAAKDPSSQSAEPGTLNETAANPDAFQKVVQGHDAQVRARQAQATNDDRAQWDKTVADFNNSSKDEPGVTKYQAVLKAALVPGQSLVTPIWRTVAGSNALVFVTPQIISGGASPNQVLLSCHLVEAPDGVLTRAGLGSFAAAPSDAVNQAVEVPNDQAEALFNTMKTNAAANEIVTVVSSPRVQSRLGMASSMMMGNQANIAGKDQFLGTRFDFFPNQSEDGTLMLEMLVRSTAATASDAAPQAGQ